MYALSQEKGKIDMSPFSRFWRLCLLCLLLLTLTVALLALPVFSSSAVPALHAFRDAFLPL